nr:hypothetical protein [Tanacetum cinerariifolium]
MENPNHLNDLNVPEGDQAPVAPDGFAPQWIGEHDPNNNNGWLEWDVPLGGEVDEPMVDLEVNEEVMDDDDWEDDVEWLMAPVTPPGATMTVTSTYEVGGPSTNAIEGPSFPLPAPRLLVPPTVIEDLSTRLGNLEYRHKVLMRKMEEVNDAEVADSIAIGEIHPRVATVEEQVQVMESHAVQVSATAGSATRFHAVPSVWSVPADLIQQSHPVPTLPSDHSNKCLLYSLPAELYSLSLLAHSPLALPVIPSHVPALLK